MIIHILDYGFVGVFALATPVTIGMIVRDSFKNATRKIV